jgi:hypothetical protein
LSGTTKGRPPEGPKIMAHRLEDKQRAAIVYAMSGSFYGTWSETGIPRQTLLNWSKTSEWMRMVREVRAAADEEFAAKLSHILAKGIEDLEDRVEHGNIIVNDKGEILGRKPLRVIEICRVLETASRIQARMREVDERRRGARPLDEIAELLRARSRLAQPEGGVPQLGQGAVEGAQPTNPVAEPFAPAVDADSDDGAPVPRFSAERQGGEAASGQRCPCCGAELA